MTGNVDWFWGYLSGAYLKTTSNPPSEIFIGNPSLSDAIFSVSRYVESKEHYGGTASYSSGSTIFRNETYMYSPQQLKQNIGSFRPRSGEIGCFIVPSTFESQVGMTFFQYLGTLNPDNIFANESTPTEKSFPLPEELQYLSDNDNVTIEVDPDGNVTITVTPGTTPPTTTEPGIVDTKPPPTTTSPPTTTEPPTTTTPPGGGGDGDTSTWLERIYYAIVKGSDYEKDGKGIIYYLEQMLAALEDIVENTKDILSELQPSKLLERSTIYDFLKDIEKNTGNLNFFEGDNNKGTIWDWLESLTGGDGGGTNLWDVVKSITDLPGKIASALGDIFNVNIDIDFAEILNGLANILDSIISLPESIIDGLFGIIPTLIETLFGKDGFIPWLVELLISLIVPRPDFLKEVFDSASDKFNAKFAFVIQVEDIINALISMLENATPKSEINIKANILGQDVDMSFDLGFAANYLPIIHGIIIAIAYISFFRVAIKRIPRLLGVVD
jgi:hypothetical protein